MGLFSDRSHDELRELLVAMQMSTLDGIEEIKRQAQTGHPCSSTGESLDKRIARATALISKMRRKGKGDLAASILAELEATPVPKVVFFRAAEPGGYEAAAAEAAAQLKAAPPDPEQARKDALWRAIVAEIRARSEG